MNDIAKRYLIIGPAWVGDMVMAQTLFKLIMQREPNAVLDILAPGHSAPLLQRMPEVNKFITLPLKHGEFSLVERFKIGRSLANNNYDQAIVLPNSWKSALIPLFAQIPIRTGWRGEWRVGLLNDMRILNKATYPLMIERFAALGLAKDASLPDKLPWPKLQCSHEQIQSTCDAFGLVLNKSTPVLILCPGAEFGSAKRWPVEHYAAVARQKLSQGWQVWLLGSAKESADTAAINQLTNNQCTDFAGKTSLAQAIDLLSCASAVVSNDSGLMHIAAALERPVVVVYGSSDPGFTPPLSKKVKVLRLGLPCSPCFQRTCPLGHLNCLVQLTPDMVLSALNEL
jgi:heptosyltransferase-2